MSFLYQPKICPDLLGSQTNLMEWVYDFSFYFDYVYIPNFQSGIVARKMKSCRERSSPAKRPVSYNMWTICTINIYSRCELFCINQRQKVERIVARISFSRRIHQISYIRLWQISALAMSQHPFSPPCFQQTKRERKNIHQWIPVLLYLFLSSL